MNLCALAHTQTAVQPAPEQRFPCHLLLAELHLRLLAPPNL